MGKQTSIATKKWIFDTWLTLKCIIYTTWKNSPIGYKLHDSIHMTFWKRQKISGWQGFKVRKGLMTKHSTGEFGRVAQQNFSVSIMVVGTDYPLVHTHRPVHQKDWISMYYIFNMYILKIVMVCNLLSMQEHFRILYPPIPTHLWWVTFTWKAK